MRQRRHILTLLCAYTLLKYNLSDTRLNYCTEGFCLKCQSEATSTSNIKYCLECFTSNIKVIKSDFNYRGGECTGTMPYENCMTVILGDLEEEGPAKVLCQQCRPGFKLTNDAKCEPIGIDFCRLWDLYQNCVNCLPGYFPSNDGLKCDSTTTKIPNCLSFGRSEDGNPACYDCVWNYMPVDDGCGARPIEDPSDVCEYPMDFVPADEDLPANCTFGVCNLYGGYFSSDVIHQTQLRIAQVESENEGESYQICTRNADFIIPFDESKFWPSPTSWARIEIDNLLILFIILYAVFIQ